MPLRSVHCLLLVLLAAVVARPAVAGVICATQPDPAGAMSRTAFRATPQAAARAAQPGAADLPWRLAFGGLTLDQAVRMAQARYGARVVRADTERNGERVYYRLRLLSSDGRVFSVRVDAQTGEMQ
ncbi:MAG: PepSY domain-containing protein [Proteobacteria bacterium]|nr:PepSY domain-containing protein [Pseudomonadota bacterium]